MILTMIMEMDLTLVILSLGMHMVMEVKELGKMVVIANKCLCNLN